MSEEKTEQEKNTKETSTPKKKKTGFIVLISFCCVLGVLLLLCLGWILYASFNKATPVIPEGASEDMIREGTWSTDFIVYDDFGQEHRLVIEFTRSPEVENQWIATVNVDPDMEGGSNTQVGFGADGENAGNTFILQFNNYGTLDMVTDTAGNTSAENGPVSITAGFNVAGANPNEDGTPYRQSFTINLGTIGSAENTVTQFAQTSSTKAREQDGYAMGYMENFKIDQSGMITGVYSNGQSRVIGQVAMATFTGQNYGAGKPKRIWEGVKSSMLMSMIYVVFTCVVLLLFSEKLALLFVDSGATDIIRNTALFLHVTAYFMPMLALLCVLRYTIQGAGYTNFAMLSGVMEMFARAGVSVWAVPALGYIAVCFGDSTAWVAADLFLVPAFVYVYRRLKRECGVI